MFSGIIENMGTIQTMVKEERYTRIQCASVLSAKLRPGNSVAMNGVCLTVTESDARTFWVDAMAVTLQKTAFHGLQEGQRVNLERALTLQSSLDGHLVQGHVDAVAKVGEMKQEGKNWFLRLSFSDAFHHLCIPEGSITVDGISLTIADIDDTGILINIIPETYARTRVGDLHAGDEVNIEFDVIGRYVARLYQPYRLIESRKPSAFRARQAIECMSKGDMLIVVDDQGRENEGDFMVPAQGVTAAAVNFMATHGKGLICQSITSERAGKLDLPLMQEKTEALHHTAFTVSVDAKKGTTTGIPAEERALTMRLITEELTVPEDFARPGHVFPIIAHDQGLPARRGQTEASVLLAREAGFFPSGVICEILTSDGAAARWNELVRMAKIWDMPIVTTEDLLMYLEEKTRE